MVLVLGGWGIGLPRGNCKVVTEYQYFWAFRVAEDGQSVAANLLTCAYLEPQDANFFKAPNTPVAVYSHKIAFTRRNRSCSGSDGTCAQKY